MRRSPPQEYAQQNDACRDEDACHDDANSAHHQDGKTAVSLLIKMCGPGHDGSWFIEPRERTSRVDRFSDAHSNRQRGRRNRNGFCCWVNRRLGNHEALLAVRAFDFTPKLDRMCGPYHLATGSACKLSSSHDPSPSWWCRSFVSETIGWSSEGSLHNPGPNPSLFWQNYADFRRVTAKLSLLIPCLGLFCARR